MSIDTLVEQCMQKKPKAQAEVYQLYARKLYATCLKYSRNQQEAEDNLHDGFITIFNKITQYKSKGSFEGWMKRIVINTTLEKYRKDKTLNLITEEIPDEIVLDIDEENIQIELLLKFIQELPNRYRLVFNLYVLDDYSHREIAEMLHISEGTSKSNLSRARMLLKEKLETNKQQNLNTF